MYRNVTTTVILAGSKYTRMEYHDQSRSEGNIQYTLCSKKGRHQIHDNNSAKT